MSENPYQSPMADVQVVGVKSGKHEDVRAVAVYQKGILICILIYLLAVIGQLFAVQPGLRLVLGLVVLAAGLAGLVFVFLLSTKVYSTGVGILLAILTLVPCLGLIVLLIVNGKATNILRQNGHKVGLLGASLSKF
jgi:uncharacterized membrane protein